MENLVSTEHKPFIAPEKIIPELTPVPLILGVVLGIIFGASSLYLALKVGMTVSASIPVAVLSITLFRYFSKLTGLRQATILENNIVQTTGSAGESIAFGVAVTMPALLILGYEMELSRIMLVAVLGGLLGVLMMIPLRYALIVKGHGELTYPEGTACAEVLTAGEKGGTSASTVFTGFFFGLIYKMLNVGARLWKDTAEHAISWFKGATVAAEVSPELLGVGYIIGPRIACITVAGGLLSSWVLTPMIKLFGDGLATPLFPAAKLIKEMSPHEIWRNYVLYIGAGAVAAGGIISLFRSLPTIIHGAKAGLSGLKGTTNAVKVLRTEVDLPLPFVLVGSVLLVLALWIAPSLHLNLLGAILIVMFGFLFVTVSSRLTGEIGSSSNPISGMTVATLLITSLVFLGLGWVGPQYRVTALSIAAIVCVAASNGGTTSQDLKTGYLVGATPKHQQTALLIGVLTSAVVIGYTLNFLNDSSTVYSQKAVPPGVVVPNVAELKETSHVHDSSYKDDKAEYKVLRVMEQSKEGPLAALLPGKYLVDETTGSVKYLVDPGINGTLAKRDDGAKVDKFEAPKARLMSLIIDGILTQKLPWGLVLLGTAIAILLELCMVPSLPFAVGVYLPLSVSAPIFFGGLIRWLVNRAQARQQKAQSLAEEESGPGILFSSGLIAGGSIAGIGLALFAANEWDKFVDLGSKIPAVSTSEWTPVVLFTVMMFVLYRVAMHKRANA